MKISVTPILMLCVGLLALWSGGCDAADYYNIGVINKTGNEIDDVVVTQAGPLGVIVKDGTKAVSSFPGRPPDALWVSWTDIAGSHRVQAITKGIVPQHFRGTVYLKLRPKEEVQASIIVEKDVDGEVR